MSDYNIRPATVGDAARIAFVKYHGWQNTYRGIISDTYLNAMSIDEIESTWKKILAPENTNNSTDVMTDLQGLVIGHVSYGTHPGSPTNIEAEIMALYLLKEYHNTGLGKRLFIHAINQIRAKGCLSFSVFVLAQNPAVGFYRSFNPDEEEMVKADIGAMEYDELRLGWRDIEKLDFDK